MLAEALLMLLQAAATAPPPDDEPSPIVYFMETLEESCEHQNCRHDVDVTLRDSGGDSHHVHRALMPPAVVSDGVSILPGEKIEAIAEFRNGKFVRWRTPTAKDGPEAFRISVEFKQNPDDAGMRATIENTGAKTLKLELSIVPMSPNSEMQAVSSCPIPAMSTSFEFWSYPIFTLVVRKARLAETSEKVVCE